MTMRDLRLTCAVALLAAYAAALPHRDAAALQQDAWDQSMAARQQPNAPEKRKRRYAGEVRRNTQLWQQLPKGGMGGHGAGATLSRHASGTMMLDGEPLPRDFSWGNVSGVSYLTSIRNQHIPTYARSFYSAPARTHKSIHSHPSPTLPLSLSTATAAAAGRLRRPRSSPIDGMSPSATRALRRPIWCSRRRMCSRAATT